MDVIIGLSIFSLIVVLMNLTYGFYKEIFNFLFWSIIVLISILGIFEGISSLIY